MPNRQRCEGTEVVLGCTVHPGRPKPNTRSARERDLA
jgi:hypothetical protein